MATLKPDTRDLVVATASS